MNRKDFLKESSFSLFSLSAILASCQPERKKEIEGATENLEPSFALTESTVDDLQKKMQSGVYTSRAIAEMYLKNIEEIDRKGPMLNSVIEINPDALTIADQMDEERKAGKLRGPLHGIPILIKDNIDTADKMMTTAGALAMEGNIASKDAFIVE